MSMSIKATRRTKEVELQISNHAEKFKRSIRQSLSMIGEIVGRESKQILSSGKRTGRTYRIKGRDHTASAPGEAPASITGKLAESYKYRVSSWHTMVVGENASYAKFLEDGTRNMLPRPHLIVAINNTSGDAINIFYKMTKRELGI